MLLSVCSFSGCFAFSICLTFWVLVDHDFLIPAVDAYLLEEVRLVFVFVVRALG